QVRMLFSVPRVELQDESLFREDAVVQVSVGVTAESLRAEKPRVPSGRRCDVAHRDEGLRANGGRVLCRVRVRLTANGAALGRRLGAPLGRALRLFRSLGRHVTRSVAWRMETASRLPRAPARRMK